MKHAHKWSISVETFYFLHTFHEKLIVLIVCEISRRIVLNYDM